MESQTKTCQNCKNNFTIEPEDFEFYKKIKVSAPTWCWKCRRLRRRAWRNDFILYSRKCDLCKTPIISIYSPNKKMTVYCNKCWWSDKWDPLEYGRDFDFSRPFFEQFRELQNDVPVQALINDDGIASVNCEYTNDFAFGKNCYLVFIAWRMEDSLYTTFAGGGKDIVDSMSVGKKSELLYESIFPSSCFRSRNIYYSEFLTNCAFCYDCKACLDCFLCVGLRHKKYCIKNKQYTKEEYAKILKSYQLDTYGGSERAKKELNDFIITFPRKFAHLTNCVNSIGDDLEDCKEAYYTFNVFNAENTRYFENGDSPKDTHDVTVGGETNQCHEGITPDQSYRALFTIYTWKSMEVSYCENCHSSKYLFGCSGLRDAEYCIFNKRYSKEEYEELKNKIIDHMKKMGEWGEFFPTKFSHFGYNETLAHQYLPLNKEEAINKGFKWEDAAQFTTGKGTVDSKDIPESIHDIDNKITEEILSCINCSRNYKIVPQELKFYRRMEIPVPRKCFFCRQSERFRFRNPYNLWHRKCTCAGLKDDKNIYQNTAKHFHSNSHCPNEFETSYAPDRQEIVYCEQCYNSEVA